MGYVAQSKRPRPKAKLRAWVFGGCCINIDPCAVEKYNMRGDLGHVNLRKNLGDAPFKVKANHG
jgi:hypothetical protein